jgi:hypothetical protein
MFEHDIGTDINRHVVASKQAKAHARLNTPDAVAYVMLDNALVKPIHSPFDLFHDIDRILLVLRLEVVALRLLLLENNNPEHLRMLFTHFAAYHAREMHCSCFGRLVEDLLRVSRFPRHNVYVLIVKCKRP